MQRQCPATDSFAASTAAVAIAMKRSRPSINCTHWSDQNAMNQQSSEF